MDSLGIIPHASEGDFFRIKTGASSVEQGQAPFEAVMEARV